jgi:sugar phosphate isomerase/epimerase
VPRHAGHGARKEYLISSGLPAQILADINGANFPHHRICTVNITRIVADLRERGARRGLDLTAAFFLPPYHPDYPELIEGAAAIRREALELLKRTDPKRYAKACREPLGRVLQ